MSPGSSELGPKGISVSSSLPPPSPGATREETWRTVALGPAQVTHREVQLDGVHRLLERPRKLVFP